MKIPFAIASVFLVGACGGSADQKPPANDSSNGVRDDRAMLASLDPKTARAEDWMTDEATPKPLSILYFSPQNVQLSASCKQSDGSLSCDALRYLQNGMPAEIPKREIDGRGPVGRAICIHLGDTPFTAKNPLGSVQTFCRFPDSSFCTLSMLEQHSLRIIQ